MTSGKEVLRYVVFFVVASIGFVDSLNGELCSPRTNPCALQKTCLCMTRLCMLLCTLLVYSGYQAEAQRRRISVPIGVNVTVYGTVNVS